jgi:hypothetical protein
MRREDAAGNDVRAALRGRSRCGLHGGLSTGPRTAEGVARSPAARLRHGRDSAETRAFELQCRAYIADGIEAAKLRRDPRLRAHLLQRATAPIPETIVERLRAAARDDVRACGCGAAPAQDELNPSSAESWSVLTMPGPVELGA